MKEMTMTEALLMAGEKAATNQYIADIEQLHRQACIADAALQEIELQDVYNIGCVDELVKLKRNAAALRTLLSMCKDAAEYVKVGIHAVFVARDAYDAEQAKRHKDALVREQEYMQKQKENKRYQEKLRGADK